MTRRLSASVLSAAILLTATTFLSCTSQQPLALQQTEARLRAVELQIPRRSQAHSSLAEANREYVRAQNTWLRNGANDDIENHIDLSNQAMDVALTRRQAELAGELQPGLSAQPGTTTAAAAEVRGKLQDQP